MTQNEFLQLLGSSKDVQITVDGKQYDTEPIVKIDENGVYLIPVDTRNDSTLFISGDSFEDAVVHDYRLTVRATFVNKHIAELVEICFFTKAVSCMNICDRLAYLEEQ